jgi:hypothetical protein
MRGADDDDDTSTSAFDAAHASLTVFGFAGA